MKHVILSSTTSDDFFFNMMKVFVYSLNQYHPEIELHIDLANGTKEQEELLKRLHSNTVVNNIELNAENPKHLIFSRPKQMMSHLLENWDTVTSIDSDCIIRGDISALWKTACPNDCLIWHKNKGKHSDAVRFQGGIYTFGNSISIRTFYQDMIDYMDASKHERYVGQTAFLVMLKKHKNSVRHVQLDEQYNDCTFRDDSLIWHAKRSHRDEGKYLKTFNELLGRI